MQNISIKVFDKLYVKLLQNFLNTEYCSRTYLHFLGLDNRDVSLIILYLVIIGISTPKIRSNGSLYHIKICC